MTSSVAPDKKWSSVLPWALFGVTAIVTVALLARGTTAPNPATRLVSRALIDFPQFAFSGARLGNLFALSPDGTRLVFAGNLVSGMRFYDVSPDGRFLMVKSDTPTAPRQLHLVVNWFEELKRLVPARK